MSIPVTEDLYFYRARHYDPHSGRFLTKDPIGFAGRDINLYRYVQNNPVNFADPWGLYGWDVHYYKTYIWAREAGIDHATAQAIAEANQATDESVFTKSTSLLAWTLGIGQPILHFPYWGSVEIELMKCTKMKMIREFGRQLHSLQDSFSHMGISPLYHVWKEIKGTSPDVYSENNPRDQAMEQLTRWWLNEFAKALNRRAQIRRPE